MYQTKISSHPLPQGHILKPEASSRNLLCGPSWQCDRFGGRVPLPPGRILTAVPRRAPNTASTVLYERIYGLCLLQASLETKSTKQISTVRALRTSIKQYIIWCTSIGGSPRDPGSKVSNTFPKHCGAHCKLPSRCSHHSPPTGR